MVNGGQREPFLPEPKMDLPHALQLGELPEDQRERLTRAKVQIFLDPVGSAAHVTHRDRGERPASGFSLSAS